jgi:hypothetical protein
MTLLPEQVLAPRTCCCLEIVLWRAVSLMDISLLSYWLSTGSGCCVPQQHIFLQQETPGLCTMVGDLPCAVS